MQRRSLLMLVIVSWIGWGCASPPMAPPLAAKDGAGIGIGIRIQPPLGPAHDAQRAYFVKLDDDGKPIDRLIHVSNYEKDGRVYLLNAPPGRYLAVAASFSVMGSGYVAYLAQPLIESTKVAARPGELAFAGSFTIDAAPFVCPESADGAQLRYAESIAPGVPKCGLLRTVIHELATRPVVLLNSQVYTLGPSTYHYRGSLREARREPADQRDFLMKAKDDLRGAGWTIEHR